MQHIHHQSNRRSGVVAVFVAFILIGLIGVVAISVDGGLLYLELRRARSTADAAAMAAACELFLNFPKNAGTDPDGTAATAAVNVAKTNGYTNDGMTSTIVVNIPPKSGSYANKAGYAEVLVTEYVERAFSRIWGTSKLPVRARAVSRGAWAPSAAGVIILDYEDKASLNAQGNGAFTETGGPVIVNSNNPSAVLNSGNGLVIADEFYITGGVQLGGNATLITQPVPNQIFLGTHPTPDPLKYLPVPDVPPDGTVEVTNLAQGNKRYTLSPGRHTNLPTFATGDEVILKQASVGAQGIYFIDGGGFKSTGATITMDPTTSGGLLIYNNPGSNAQSEKIQITRSPAGKVDLMGFSEGPYTGIMLWQKREATVDLLVEGNGEFSIQGTLYSAGAKLNVNGNGKTSAGDVTGWYYDKDGNKIQGGSRIASQYITNNLSLGGNGNVKLDYTYKDKARTRIIALVE